MEFPNSDLTDQPSTISYSLGEHDMLISQQLENEWAAGPEGELMSVAEEATEQLSHTPESQQLSGIGYQQSEIMMEQKELLSQRLREATSNFRDRLNQKYMKVEVESVGGDAGNFGVVDLEDENEELVQVQREKKATHSNGDAEADYDRIFIQQ